MNNRALLMNNSASLDGNHGYNPGDSMISVEPEYTTKWNLLF